MDKTTIWFVLFVISVIVFMIGIVGLAVLVLDNLQSDKTTEIIYDNATIFDDANNEMGYIRVPIDEKTVFNSDEPSHRQKVFAAVFLSAIFVGFICMALTIDLFVQEVAEEEIADEKK